ncbi:hypothetical protein FHR81_001740 [Actinoalloteichus hoggarensis]|uniref:Uncharacterized protein n=1 Tax=Actinoalloteichus hoggarensis TaxID=1470176 RepID=A0A221W4F3_9PSEU|nr:hypothetical protein AHOG_15730 [Actinoalloteichus hoggarensis]MBB5920702.1 hypothetical protein [Actinoalloteichus hoggarensis]
MAAEAESVGGGLARADVERTILVCPTDGGRPLIGEPVGTEAGAAVRGTGQAGSPSAAAAPR